MTTAKMTYQNFLNRSTVKDRVTLALSTKTGKDWKNGKYKMTTLWFVIQKQKLDTLK